MVPVVPLPAAVPRFPLLPVLPLAVLARPVVPLGPDVAMDVGPVPEDEPVELAAAEAPRVMTGIPVPDDEVTEATEDAVAVVGPPDIAAPPLATPLELVAPALWPPVGPLEAARVVAGEVAAPVLPATEPVLAAVIVEGEVSASRQVPPEQICRLEHAVQAAPATPQALALGAWHTLEASQQPLQVAAEQPVAGELPAAQPSPTARMLAAKAMASGPPGRRSEEVAWKRRELMEVS